MPSVDEQLSRALREAAPRPTTSGLDQRLARRRRARAVRRQIGTAALAVVVLAGTAAGFLALSDAFEGDQPAREPSPSIVPGPKENGPLVFVADGDLGTHLELDRLDGSAAVRLTDPQEEIVRDPAPAPDGRRVAFVSLRPDEELPVSLVVMDVVTGERSVVTDDGVFADPTWSPGGGSIAYEGVLEGRIGIVTVDLATGDRRFLTEGADPSWSPDGSTIAFELPSDRPPDDVGQQGIYEVPATGGEPTPIIESGASPAWSPDGSMLAFTRVGGVWVARTDGDDERLLIGHTPNEVPLGLIDPGFADPSWAPDGSRVMYTFFTPERSWIDSIAPGDDAMWRLAPSGTDPVWRLAPAGTDAAWLPLSDPEPEASETPTPGADAAEQLAGVPFLVCRPMSIPGDFGPGLDTAWIFEEERVPGAGCLGSEGFQHVGVGTADEVTAFSEKLTSCLDSVPCWLYAAPDVDDDGTDEIAVAVNGTLERGSASLVLYRADGGGVVSITLDCGPACRPAPFIDVGPVPSGTSGAVCDVREGVYGMIRWFGFDDSNALDGALWVLGGRVLRVTDIEEHVVVDGAPGVFGYPDGTDDLCGSRTHWPVDFPAYPTPAEPNNAFGLSRPVCNVQDVRGDVDGDGIDDTVVVATVARGGGCPDRHERYLLGIDLDGDDRVDVETEDIDCGAWCAPFAAVDLSFDGKAEILITQGHTASPTSAVIGVYELVFGDLQPVLFPNQTNRFLLVNSSWQGYHGAYCVPDDGVFVTWHGETDAGGNLERVTYDFLRLDERTLRFEPLPQVGPVYSELPPVEHRGYDGMFCGVEVDALG